MKRLISAILILLLFILQLSFLSIKSVFAWNETYFVVTAYYSPLPNQNYYLKWNYESEIKLNWRWFRWASWKEVFSWMIAAPKNYEFWTKIYLEWVWIWSVEDRWWAIVNAWQRGYKYDRIDIWMWYWEEWLKRSLAWWKRIVKWYVMAEKEVSTTIDINSFPAPKSALNRLIKSNNIFNIWIWIKSKKDDIIKLQTFLKNIWLYNWEINGKYDQKTIDSILNFQKENWLIKSDWEYWAWYWGASTRKLVMKMYLDWKFKVKESQNNYDSVLSIFNKNIWQESNSEDIKKIQSIFKDMWLFDWDISWNYEDIKDELISYQIKKWLIKNKNDWWAWYFWPKTREAAKKDYISYIENKKREKEKQDKIEKLKKNIEKKVDTHLAKIWNPKIWDVWDNVRTLQKTLKVLWYFNVKDTAIFWPITSESIFKYQVDKWLVINKTDPWAWKFWPKTKENLRKDLVAALTKKVLKENNLLAMK